MKIPENPLNNLPMFFTRICMYRLTKLIAYDKSGQEQTMPYIKEPTTLEYGTLDMYSISLSVTGH
jgi:hypothetical protein